MISFLTPEDQATLRSVEPMADLIAKAHAQFANELLTEALKKKFGGVMPPPEQITAHVVRVTEMGTNVVHYVWMGHDPKVGEMIDMSEVLCSIAPPKIFNPDN